MALRDAGWIQLFAASNQEAVDLHVLGFRLAEELSVPVMVCVDGFILTHAVERIDVPTQEDVDALLPPFEPMQVLDPAHPVTIGALVGPEAFTEVKVLAHYKQLRALERIPVLASELRARLGRESGGLVRPYRIQGAETIVVALGSVNGTIEEVVDAMRAEGIAVGSLAIGAFRPFPRVAVREALRSAERVIVVEKNLAVGMGGVLSSEVRTALETDACRVHAVIAGLGGRAITRASIRRAKDRAREGLLEDVCFLDVDESLVARELARMGETRRSGPHATNLMRDAPHPMRRIV
jgi:pyruvate ferredoxin oxidoreductase alpha subunit